MGLWGVVSATPPSHALERIIVGTSAIQFAVRELTGNETELAVVIPPDTCPGHFDLKPSDLEKFQNADLILLHTWQKELPAIQSLLKHTQFSENKVIYVPIEGSWLVPKKYLSALKYIGNVLVQLGILAEHQLKEKLSQRKAELDKFEQQILQEVKELHPENTPILCSVFQKEFLLWLGCNIVDIIPRGDEITLQKWGELLNKGKSHYVKIVVENQQSGEIEMIKRLAKELSAQSVVLSNFPGACPGCNTWENSVKHNVDALIKALKASS